MWACAAMLLGGLRPAAAAAPEALQQVPGNADLVIMIPDLAELSGKLANLRQALNLSAMELNDVLAGFKRLTGMTAGVNDNGTLMIVMTDLAQAIESQHAPQTLLIMPVSDYGAFVGNLGGSADEDVTGLTMPSGQHAFSRHTGDYAVVGKTREQIQAYAPGNAADAIAANMGDLGRHYLQSSDALVYINLESVGQAVLPAIGRGIAMMGHKMQRPAGAGPAHAAHLRKLHAMSRLSERAMAAFVRDATGLTLALDISDAGIGYTEALAYKPDSALAKVFPEGAANPTALTALPSQPFIFALAMDTRAIALAPLLEQWTADMPKGENAMLPDAALWLPLIQKARGFATAFYAPDDMAMMSGNVMNTLTVVDVDKPAPYVAALKNYVTKLNGFQVSAAAPTAPPAGPARPPHAPHQGAQQANVKVATSYRDNALQLDGVQVDQFQVTAAVPPQLMQQMGRAGGVLRMFTNYGGYVAAKDDKVVITTMIDPQMVTRSLQAIEQSGGIGAGDAVGRVRDAALPPDSEAEAYISVSGIARTANIIMAMLNKPAIEAPADLPPIAMGLSSRANSMALRAYLPIETAGFLIDTGMRIAGPMMMGGPSAPQGPGAPGRGGPPPF